MFIHESLNVSSLIDGNTISNAEAHAGFSADSSTSDSSMSDAPGGATLDAPVHTGTHAEHGHAGGSAASGAAREAASREAASREPGAFGKVTFADMNLSPLLLEVLTSEGYEKPTPIQAKAIPVAMAGRDILGSAQTGTGKTAAFALPILHRLQTDGPDKTRRGPAVPRALILAPTRELAAQIHESLVTYGRKTTLRHACVYGGTSMYHQIRALRSGVDVLIATPGRLIDLMEQGHADLSGVEIFVLDEADRMLDMGFIQPIKRISQALTSPKPRQTMLFSATMAPAIRQLASALLKDPQQIAVAAQSQTAARIEQKAYYVDSGRKFALLLHLLGADGAENAAGRAVVFTRTKFGAERLAGQLERQGVSADAIHGNKAQSQRKRALDAFRGGRVRVLVATDVAARGLDVDDVTHVFNFDLPMEPEAYVHRIGRTGRAGCAGVAISFVTPADADELRQIQRLTKATIQIVTQLPTGLVRLPKEPRGDEREDESGPAREGFARPYRSAGPYAGRASSAQGGHGGGGYGGGGQRRDQGRDSSWGHAAPGGHAPASAARPVGHASDRAYERPTDRPVERARPTSSDRITRADLGLPPNVDRRVPRSGPNGGGGGSGGGGYTGYSGGSGSGGSYASPRAGSGSGSSGPRSDRSGSDAPRRGPGGPGRGPGGPGRGPSRGPGGGGRGPSRGPSRGR